MTKGLKRGIVVLLLVVLSASLSGCGEEKKAETAVQGMFTAFQALDFAEAEKFVNMESIADLEAREGGILQPKLLMEALFDKLDYKIVSSEKKSKNTVMVRTEVTAADMTALVNAWLPELFQSMLNEFMDGQQSGSEEQNQKMIDSFLQIAAQDGHPTVTQTVDIPVVYSGGVWRAEGNEEFVDAVMGGLKDAAAAISEAFDI